MEPVVVHLGPSVTLICGDCLEVLPALEEIDAVVTDPPYSSGGAFRGDRTQSTVAKYVNTDSVATCRTEFTGDNRDSRSFLAWCSLWMTAAHGAAKDGAVFCCFTDWRQLPILTDAVQCGGWVWRNIVTWWKPGVRMQRGRFSSSAEYVLYCSKGVPAPGEQSPQNVLSIHPVSGDDKEHVAEKPVDLMAWILGVTPKGATVLDPFMGSGTTGAACIRTGRGFIGIEKDPHYFGVARKRLERELSQIQGSLDFGGGAGAPTHNPSVLLPHAPCGKEQRVVGSRDGDK
jgi:site-specific DNA-methyltransferase (adenine-specific)